ncbi:MAG: hypothetical protein A2Y48_03820 [Nitrospirae bacterium RIFCSPLOW2_12_42_9]|nr:MAG: hypothetical protein A2Y48_03820 [Nitrospirae bacterium RIFCSPLOW2_12_42_9]
MGEGGIFRWKNKVQFLQLLNNLNPSQRKAVEYTEGPLLVLAGAGSGKTRVITFRIAHLIYNQGIFPGNILAVTFTNKAAEEMKGRILKLCKSAQNSDSRTETRNHMDGIWIGTFHSICLRLLRRHCQVLGFRNDFTIYDKSDQMGLVKECVRELNINEDMYSASSISSRISFLKGRMITPDEFSRSSRGFGIDDKVLKVYSLYQDKLVSNNAMDFDDLIIRCINLFEKESEILSRYQDKFRYILVDEYQDTNPSQYRLLNLFADKHKNICAVGDDDQSIYRFRGAEIQNILNFEKDYPSAMVIKLEQNYRSTGSILNLAGQLIEKNRGRRGKRLWTENPGGEPVVYNRVDDERGEAKYIVNSIRSMMRDGRTPSHFAVLYRTNAQSRVIEEGLRDSGIPYIIIGGIKFYERREVKDIIAYIRLALRADDDFSLRRIINVPQRGIGKVTLKSIDKISVDYRTSLYEAVIKMSVENPRLGKFIELIESLRPLVNVLSPSGFVKKVFELTGYTEALKKDDNADDRIENIFELLGAVKKYEEKIPDGGLRGFLDEVSLLSDIDEHINLGASQTKEEKGYGARNSVSLMTLHSAKGLEFPVVFITGLEDGILPHVRSLDREDDIEEERRLCYVGVTRAMERLYLTAALNRSLFGQSQTMRESRFLRDIKRDVKLGIEIEGREMYNKKQ